MSPRPGPDADRAPSGRAGLALFTTLLVLLALAVLSSGLLLLARQEQRVAHTRALHLAARVAAASAAARAAGLLRRPLYAALPAGHEVDVPGAGVSMPPARATATVERLGRAQLLVRGRGESGAASGWARASVVVGLLLETVDPLDPWRDFPAAVTVTTAASVTLGARARVEGIDAGDVGALATCGADTLLAQLFGAVPRPAVSAADPSTVRLEPGALLTGAVPLEPWLPDPPSRSGSTRAGAGMRVAHLAALAERSARGPIRLAPLVAGDHCDTTSAGNWGAPLDPLDPCGSYAPVILADNDLDLLAGDGQGILIARGQLVLRTGTRFFGLVLAAGGLVLESGAEIRGALRTVGSSGVTLGGRVAYDPCVIRRVLEASTVLSRPFLPSSRRWIPAF